MAKKESICKPNELWDEEEEEERSKPLFWLRPGEDTATILSLISSKLSINVRPFTPSNDGVPTWGANVLDKEGKFIGGSAFWWVDDDMDDDNEEVTDDRPIEGFFSDDEILVIELTEGRETWVGGSLLLDDKLAGVDGVSNSG